MSTVVVSYCEMVLVEEVLYSKLECCEICASVLVSSLYYNVCEMFQTHLLLSVNELYMCE